MMRGVLVSEKAAHPRVAAQANRFGGKVECVETGQIGLDNFAFNPPMLTIPVGTTVTWTNHDTDEHTVTSSTHAFSSAGLDPNETYSHRSDTAGTCAYFCALHPHMTAQIVVQ